MKTEAQKEANREYMRRQRKIVSPGRCECGSDYSGGYTIMEDRYTDEMIKLCKECGQKEIRRREKMYHVKPPVRPSSNDLAALVVFTAALIAKDKRLRKIESQKRRVRG
jgi:predicted 2-oxoglutarate/Fe(II)-dependent dioxygenase YbiX